MLDLIRTDDGFTLTLNGIAIIDHRRDSPCLFVGTGEPQIEMYRGNFEVRDRLHERVALDECAVAREGGAYVIVLSKLGVYPCVIRITEEEGRAVLRFDERPAGLNRLWLRVTAEKGERVYGCGEQFSYFNLRGRTFPLWTSEQGVGRNKMTYTTFQADVLDRCGGDYWWTFYPQPTFVSTRRYYCHVDGSAYMDFDFRNERYHELQMWEFPAALIFESGPDLLDVVCRVSGLLGRQPELPAWVHDGVWLGIQGGTETCLAKLQRCLDAGVKVGGIWAQDWQGRRITSFGKRLMWNWQWDEKLYPGLPEAIKKLRDRGVRFLGYINPYVAIEGELFKEASGKGYLAKDRAGADYLVEFGEFYAGVVDFTIPAAVEWYKGVIKKEMIDFGLAGWMADFGEYLPTDLVLADGDPMLKHNEWPALWARVNREAVEEAGALGEVVFFMRAGYTGSQRWCTMMWGGDQNVDWSRDDGLPSVIPAALSLSMIGNGLFHSDIGGYTTLYGMKRTKELFMRWAEQAAFTPLMRTHEGNRPDDNWQFDSDDETLAHFARMSRLFTALGPYTREAVKQNAVEGLPVMRPLFLHYSGEDALYDMQSQYLYGRDLLVAPVLEPGAVEWKVYLPEDRWIHLWSGEEHGGGVVTVAAPLGEPPVFYRAESSWRESFEKLRGAAVGL